MSANVTAAGSPSVQRPAELTAVTTGRLAPTEGRTVLPALLRAGHRGRRTLLLAAVGVVLAGTALAWRASQAAPAIQYVTVAVTTGDVTRAITASGTVNPVDTIQVGTYVSGVIQQLYCDFNTKVHKGQLCAKIDPRPYQSIVDQNKATLSTARAQLAKDQTALDYAKVSYARAVNEQGIVSQDTIDNAKNAYDQAAAQVELDKSTVQERQAALSAATINLQFTNIISPVNGTVVSRNVTMGQTVAASFQTPTLFLVATDLTKMQVDTNVSESDIGGIKVGNSTTFTVEAFPDHPFAGEVTEIRQAPQTVQNIVTYDVVIDVPNPDLLLKPGMTATVRVIVDQRRGIMRVPDQALRYVPGGLAGKPASGGAAPAARVWVLRNGQPTALPITVGLDDDAYAEVLSGDLKPGDHVVTGEQAGAAGSASRLSFFRL